MVGNGSKAATARSILSEVLNTGGLASGRSNATFLENNLEMVAAAEDNDALVNACKKISSCSSILALVNNLLLAAAAEDTQMVVSKAGVVSGCWSSNRVDVTIGLALAAGNIWKMANSLDLASDCSEITSSPVCTSPVPSSR
jgi:hypothetical protein